MWVFDCPHLPWTKSILKCLSLALIMWSICLFLLYFQTEVSPWCSIKDGPFFGSWLPASICRRNWLRPAFKDKCQHPIGSGPGWVLSWGPGTVIYSGGMDFKFTHSSMRIGECESEHFIQTGSFGVWFIWMNMFFSIVFHLLRHLHLWHITNSDILHLFLLSDMGSALSGSDCGF